MAVCSATWLAITIAVFVGNHRRPTAVWEGYRDPIAWAVLLWPALGAHISVNILKDSAALCGNIKFNTIATAKVCEHRAHCTRGHVVPAAENLGLRFWGVCPQGRSVPAR